LLAEALGFFGDFFFAAAALFFFVLNHLFDALLLGAFGLFALALLALNHGLEAPGFGLNFGFGGW
jgi:hypothetical protein